MAKILEKMHGNRCILVCERNDEFLQKRKVKLVSKVEEIETPCSVIPPRECFSEDATLLVMLPDDFDESKLDSYETMFFL